MIRAYRLVKRYQDCQLVLAVAAPPTIRKARRCFGRWRKRRRAIRISVSQFAPMEPSGNQRLAARITDRHSEVLTGGLWPDGKRGAVEEEAGGGFGGRRHSIASDSQTHRHAGAFAGGNRVPNQVPAGQPGIRQVSGENGYQHVKEHFLVTQNLRRYLVLFLVLLQDN